MATSWQYNTSANMGSYGSITAMHHMPNPSTMAALGNNTSNSQYGAWFGSGTAPGYQSRGSTPGTPIRTLGTVTVPSSANLKPGSSIAVTLNPAQPTQQDPTKEKFSTLANKFGNGRILTPITSQYDQIMQEEEESNIHKRLSQTPHHSPEPSPRDTGYRKMMYKDESGQRNTFENSFDSRNGMSMASKRPGFERAQSFVPSANQSPSLTNGLNMKYDNLNWEPSKSSLQRSNTFTGTGSDLATNRFASNLNNVNGNNKHSYPWKHDPRPPTCSSSGITISNGILLADSKDPLKQNGIGGLTSTQTDSNDLMPKGYTNSTCDHPLKPAGFERQVSQEKYQNAGMGMPEFSVESAGSQRSSVSSQESSRSHSTSLGGSSIGGSDNSGSLNSMYWLYGSRGRPPPTPYRPNTYMYKMDNGGDSMKFPPSPPTGNPSFRSELNSKVYSGSASGSNEHGNESSLTLSPRSRLHALHSNYKYIDPVTEDPDYDNLGPSDYGPGYSGYGSLANGHRLEENPAIYSNAVSGSAYETKITSPPGKNTKSILKKTSSYNSARGTDFPIFTGVDTSSVPRYMDTGNSPLPPLARAPSGAPIPIRKIPSGSGKRVTFRLTPHMKEISPREESSHTSCSMMSMFSNFRFEPSLLEHSEI